MHAYEHAIKWQLADCLSRALEANTKDSAVRGGLFAAAQGYLHPDIFILGIRKLSGHRFLKIRARRLSSPNDDLLQLAACIRRQRSKTTLRL